MTLLPILPPDDLIIFYPLAACAAGHELPQVRPMNNTKFLQARKGIATLTAAFTLAAPLPARAVGAQDTAPSLWKTEGFDAVVELAPCPEKGACGHIYWLNPDDTRLFDYFGDKSRLPAGAEPTRKDVEALCGFSPDMEMHRDPDAPDHWHGNMEMRGMGLRVRVDAERDGPRKLDITFSKAIFWHSET